MKRWERRHLLDDRLWREMAKNDRARASHSPGDDIVTGGTTMTRYLPVLRQLRSEPGRIKIPLGP